MTFLSQLRQQFTDKKPIYIVTHERADGDGIGSQIALTLYLNRFGLEAYCLQSEALSDAYDSFLTGVPVCALSEHKADAYWVAVDCGNPMRVSPELRSLTYTAVIDHHPIGEPWVERCWIHPERSSNCELLLDLFLEDGYRLDHPSINNALYMGILTDTGSFSHNNVTADTFVCAERLVRAGVQPYRIIQKLFKNKTLEQFQLYCLYLKRLRLYESGTIAVARLDASDYVKTHTERMHTEGFVNQPLGLKQTKISIFVETNTTYVKVSLRSIDPVFPVNAVAKLWGGFGHVCAAGFKCHPLQFSLRRLIHACSRCIQDAHEADNTL